MFPACQKYYHLLFIPFLICFSFSIQAKSLEGFNKCSFYNLIIQGATNVNQFILTYQHQSIDDKFKKLNSNLNEEQNHSLVNFNIPVQYIEGENKTLVNDFHRLFKADDFPYIVVGVKKGELQNLIDKPSEGTMDFDITIAGITKTVESQYVVGDIGKDEIFFNGSARIHLTDFNIDPPVKFFGIIKVKNEVFINFKILLIET